MSTIYFFDVDNTVIDNDHITADIAKQLTSVVGPGACKRYWEIYEEIRKEKGYADYLAALQQFRLEDQYDPRLIHLSIFLTDYPFANRLYPQSLDAIARGNTWGTSIILTDGDVVFQPRKIYRSGLADAVQDRILIYIHKEQELDDVEQRYPADHYVMIDDKLRILTEMKRIWGSKLTTVFVKQGHYADDPEVEKKYPPADIKLNHIWEFMNLKREELEPS